jgi:hypothetical protein
MGSNNKAKTRQAYAGTHFQSHCTEVSTVFQAGRTYELNITFRYAVQ